MDEVDVRGAAHEGERDDVDPQATRERAYALSLCGFGGDDRDERVARRVDRFAAAATGSFVWTRDADGTYRLGRTRGPYRYDADPEAVLPGAGPVADLLTAVGDDTERVDEPRLFAEPARASWPAGSATSA